ncbi:MAG: Ldh family oxidoreductase [Burkholderiaceae bacterium]
MTKLSKNELTTLTQSAFVALGLSPEDAREVAYVLVTAELFGLTTHGVSRVESYGERLRVKGINPTPNITVETCAPSLFKVDGDNAVGPLVGMKCLNVAMLAAKAQGVAVVLARNSNHFGPISPYSLLAAEQGFATIIGSNATTTIAPWGGSDARLGNSPLGFGVPNPKGPPFLLDMAMSVVARAKIRNAFKAGQSIPDTWATDAKGVPTNSPKDALDGFLLPIGGHKGYGLALWVDMLAGLLSGAAYLTHVKSWLDEPDLPQNLGHFFILINTQLLGNSDWLAQRMHDFAAILHDSEAADPQKPVIVPGEIELNKMQDYLQNGIPIDDDLLLLLQNYSKGHFSK